MQVVHISASNRHGGASLAAWRLNAALRERGVASRLLVERRVGDDESVDELGAAHDAASLDAAADDAIRYIYRDTNRTPLSNTHFTLPVSGVDLRQHPLVREADVLHLHWVSSFLTARSIKLLQSLGKPIVWTLHDFEPFTGGCHFPAGCARYTTSCAVCPQLRDDPLNVPAAVLREKIDLLGDADITLIAPSAWIAARAQESRVFRRAEHVTVIPNCVDTRLFTRYPASDARRAFGLAEEATYVLCVADQGLQSRKGVDLLGQIMRRCQADPRFQRAHGAFLLVGRECPRIEADGASYTHLGHLASEAEMALAYSAADMVLLPSLEDNLPNVALEALASGAPVVGFDVGGIPEVVQNQSLGRAVPHGDVDALGDAVAELAADAGALERMRAECRALAVAEYSYSAVADQHLRLYESLLGGRTNAAGARGAVDPRLAIEQLLPDLRLYCLSEQVRSLQRQLAESERDRQAQLTVIEGLRTAANDRMRLLQELESTLAERLEVLERLHSELEVRAHLIEWQESELVERGREIEQLASELTKREQLIVRLDTDLAAHLQNHGDA